jgi:hypothetical protein
MRERCWYRGREQYNQRRAVTAGERHCYAPHVEAVQVADVGPGSLLAANSKAAEDSGDNVDEPRLREVNNSLSQCHE